MSSEAGSIVKAERAPSARRLALTFWAVSSLLFTYSPAEEVTSLPHASPESQGVSSNALLNMIDALDASALGLHGIVIVRHGHVIAEGWWAPYSVDEPHMLFSVSKSFTSIAIGIAQGEGRLSINDKLLSFFPHFAAGYSSEHLRALRLRDLLMMASGHEPSEIAKIDIAATKEFGIHGFFGAPITHKPGTLFCYNTPGTFMLSAALQNVTGETLRDYLGPRLFEPLGIGKPDWELTSEGYSYGGTGLSLRTEDLAKFGQLLLQGGEWKGRRLVPAQWIETATSRQISTGSDPADDWDQGYGFQFWRCVPDFYRSDGAFGQFCIVMPQYDAVVAINSGTYAMRDIMKILWERLLPELRPVSLPEDVDAQARLQARLSSLSVPMPSAIHDSQGVEKYSNRRYYFPENESSLEWASIHVAPDGSTIFRARLFGHDEEVQMKPDHWVKNTFPITTGFPITPGSRQPVSAAGGLTDRGVYTIKMCQYRSPFVVTLTLKFTDNELAIESASNVSFSRSKPPILKGSRGL